MIISFVIPNYNGLPLLQKNIPRLVGELEKEHAYQFEIIIVDDCSTDGSTHWIGQYRAKFNSKNIRITFLSNSTNFGFATTANKGAFSANGEFIVFLNSDVYPKHGFLTPTLSHFSDPSVFAVGFMDESKEQEKTILRGRGIGWWERGFYVHKRGEVDGQTTDWVSGGSGMFRKKMFIELKGFDECYSPFYWEDIDLSYRAKQRGYRIMFEKNSIVVHEHTKGAIKTLYTSQKIKEISYRNQFIFVWKNADPGQLMLHIFWLPYHVVRSVMYGDFLFISGFYQALVRYITYKDA